MSKIAKNNTITISIIVAVISLIIGYVLGALIGFGSHDSGTNKWAGTYTNTSWNGGSASLVLNSDGTCKLPSQYEKSCTYEVRDGHVYFNGQTTSETAIGETGIVYYDHTFTKLK